MVLLVFLLGPAQVFATCPPDLQKAFTCSNVKRIFEESAVETKKENAFWKLVKDLETKDVLIDVMNLAMILSKGIKDESLFQLMKTFQQIHATLDRYNLPDLSSGATRFLRTQISEQKLHEREGFLNALEYCQEGDCETAEDILKIL